MLDTRQESERISHWVRGPEKGFNLEAATYLALLASAKVVEGSDIGVVKNLFVVTVISTACNSIGFVRNIHAPRYMKNRLN